MANCLPATTRALGPRLLADLFRRHAADSWPAGPKRHRDDAITFAGRLARGELLPDVPPWLADAAAFESAALQARDPSRRLVITLLRYRPDALIPALLAGQPGDEVPRRPTLVAWIRWRAGGDARFVRASVPGLGRSLIPSWPPPVPDGVFGRRKRPSARSHP
ncbi:hypothetical protein [Aquisphaera giovannonii]|uniref:hypothetical protein n=1 Tax=Aquisphaera giovannonii TaxID=406548 RepID=UPI0011DF209D|nr:hypothetical protein [Aquisphaera giovannonii]